jgi:hypothetical protein
VGFQKHSAIFSASGKLCLWARLSHTPNRVLFGFGFLGNCREKKSQTAKICESRVRKVSTLMEIPQGNTLENRGKQNPKMGFESPPERGRPPLVFVFEELTFYDGNAFSSLIFSRSMIHALLFNRSCTRLSAHQRSTATAWTFFQIAWTDQNLDSDNLMSRLKSKTTPVVDRSMAELEECRLEWPWVSVSLIQAMPPLARSVWPLIQPPSRPTRKDTVAAISSGVPSRSIGGILAR